MRAPSEAPGGFFFLKVWHRFFRVRWGVFVWLAGFCFVTSVLKQSHQVPQAGLELAI